MEKEVGPASQHPPNNRLHLTSAPVTRLADATRAPCRLRRLPLQVNLHVRKAHRKLAGNIYPLQQKLELLAYTRRRSMSDKSADERLERYRRFAESKNQPLPEKEAPHWTEPIREDIRDTPGLDARTCFFNLPDEKQRDLVEEIVRDETEALGYALYEIDCSQATEATFRGEWILELNKPGVRAYPDWWGEQPARVLIKNIDQLSGDAISAMAQVVDWQFNRDIPCNWMFVFLLTKAGQVPRSVIEHANPSIKRIWNLPDLGWKPGAGIR